MSCPTLFMFCKIKHVHGKANYSDIFTKEDRDKTHFIDMRDVILSPSSKRVIYHHPMDLTLGYYIFHLLALVVSLPSVGGVT